MLNNISFPTEYKKILERVSTINPLYYAKSRNNLDGAVTYISPYLTHGVISLPKVRGIVLEKYSVKDSYTFIFELAWREFFQRVYAEEGDNIFHDLKSSQIGVKKHDLPEAIITANTSIVAIDSAYKKLYETGYMHNHARMWSAMLAVNVGHYEWWNISRHMFYYLLDGDKASNTLSWQWVAGTFSSKQYVANQEMINKFTKEKQYSSYLNTDTSLLTTLYPIELEKEKPFELYTDFSLFKSNNSISDINSGNILLYSIWTLDPIWEPTKDLKSKILFIDQDELTDFPISKMRINFILELLKNITDIKIVIGTNDELISWAKENNATIYRKDHPAIYEWPGIVSGPEYLFPEIVNVPRGFMSFWKKCESYLYK